MVSRVELLLIAAILFFATSGIVTEISQTEHNNTTEHKALELVSAQLHEVNQTDIQNRITASRMVQYPDRTVFEDFNLQTTELNLTTPHAQQKDQIIYLGKQATIRKTDGTHYSTSDASYNKQTRVLTLSGAFAIQDQHGDINGTQMRYNANKQAIEGENVKAKYEME